MLETPQPEHVNFGFVFPALAELEFLPHVIVERGNIRRGNCRRLRIVFRLFAERIKGRAGEARIEAAGGQPVFILQVLLKFSAIDAQVRLLDISGRQAGVLVQLFDDGPTLVGGKGRAGLERDGVVVHGEVLDLGNERLQIRVRLGQPVVIPGAGGIGGKVELVGDIDAGIAIGEIGIQREVQDLREQDDAVEIDVAFGFEEIGEHGRARGAVAFTK